MHFYQYREKLLETVLPLKRTGRDYFIGALSLADSLGLKGPDIDSCRTMFAFENFSIGDEYDRLNVEILAKTKELGADLSKEEKENIVFQLQDISYELQDKAIQLHEEGLAFAKKHALDTDSWSHKILESLARLNPTKYGRTFYQSVAAASDSSWIVRPDSAAGWNSIKPPLVGWQAAAVVSAATEKHLADAHAFILKGAGSSGPAFFWKHLYLAGAPRSAEVRALTRNPYRLFVNGVLILSDTAGKATQPALPDSAIGITATLRGGDNWMALETNTADSTGIRMAAALNAMVDTTEHFAPSSVVMPHVVFAPVASKPDSSASALPPPEPLPVIVPHSSLPPAPEDTVKVPKTREELARVLAHFQAREARAQEDVVKEQMAIDRLKAERDSVDAQLLLINRPADTKSGAGQK